MNRTNNNCMRRRAMMRRCFWLFVALSSNLACDCGAFGTGGPVALQRNIHTSSSRTSTLHRAVAVKEETTAVPTETTTSPVVRRHREHVPIRHVPETVVAKEKENKNENVAVTRRSRTVLASAAAAAASDDDDQQFENASASRTSAASSPSSEATDARDTRASAEEDSHDDDDLAAQRRQAAKRAALLAKGTRTRSKHPKTNTSVGARRVASASKGRLQATASSKLADALRKTAQGTAAAAAAAKRKQNNNDNNNNNNNDMSTSKAQQQQGQPLLDLNVPTIHSTIDQLLQAQKPSFDTTTTKRKEELTAAFSSFDMPTTTRPSMGILGEPDLATKTTTTTTTTLVDITDTNNMFVEVDDDDDDECQPLYYPGATILGPDDDEDTTTIGMRNKRRGRKRRFTVRVATPADDVPISSLRLSVFSHFTAAQQGQFCSRSCQAIAGRRVRGATCLVASMPCAAAASRQQQPPPSLVVGSIECSFHEFFSTRLGQRRPQFSLLYITEVAVHPASRRQGIGRDLLLAADKYAASRGVETLYLHVDVTNHGAIQLYEQAGYRRVRDRLSSKNNGDGGPDHDNSDNNTKNDDPPVSVFMEFTKSLNLHPGATRGREHFLLCKDLTPHPTWLEERPSVVVVEQGANDDDDDNDDEHDDDDEHDNNDDNSASLNKKKQPQHGWNSLVEGTFGFAIPA